MITLHYEHIGIIVLGTGEPPYTMYMLFQGLDNIKDHLALWTNRAQAHIKLEKYAEAIEDCEWALKVSKHTAIQKKLVPQMVACLTRSMSEK